jgi:hypothetical protein
MFANDGDGGPRMDFRKRDASMSRLPKIARLIGGDRLVGACDPQPSAMRLAALYEFEALTGNASYREGERFYLTPAQARRIYLFADPAQERAAQGGE